MALATEVLAVKFVTSVHQLNTEDASKRLHYLNLSGDTFSILSLC